MSKIIEALPTPPVYYHAVESSYWRQDGKSAWIKVNESTAKSFIADYGYSKTATATGSNSEVERCLMKIQSEHNVVYVGPLAGHEAGIHEMAGNLVLVTTGPKWIEAKAGPWPTLDKVFASMFVDGVLDQRPYFYGWLKSARDSLLNGRWKASQLFAMAGPVGTGKSLTQNLITLMLGGRSTKPFQYMMGQTTFNSHMFRGEHQMLEDEAESIDIRSRRQFAANIKTILTNKDQNCHGKNREALTLQPVWRMTLSLNDDPERLLVLPPFDSDVRDKIIVLKVSKASMPMKTGTVDAETEFWERLVSELPAFLDHIDHYVVPAELQDSRYGIVAYQHPEIVDKIQDTAPEIKLLEIIDGGLWSGQDNPRAWDGTAAQLEKKLTRENGQVSYEARRLLSWNNAAGTYLARLRDSKAEQAQGRVQSRKVNGNTVWTIAPARRATDEPEPVAWASSEPCEPPSLPAGLREKLV